MLIKENVSLADKTSYHIGGATRWYAVPTSEKDLLTLFRFQKEQNIPCFILGKGSNLLVSDHGFYGLVIDMRLFNTISINTCMVSVQAGASLSQWVIHCIKAGLAGNEDLAGIPGSVGGGLAMNAGAYRQTISDNLRSVRWFDRDSQQIFETEKKDLHFAYRSSFFQKNNAIILSACFDYIPGDPSTLIEHIRSIQKKRNASQPLHLPSCGSVFKRPEGHYAGALIEAAGLKGLQCGGAQISETHANFIVNTGAARAHDVYSLISHARQKVFEQNGILLEAEVIFVGDFDFPLWLPTLV